ncbi:hypothetical protein CHRYSEOSP005_02750 [Chryseobacterium sp. Alg-005]
MRNNDAKEKFNNIFNNLKNSILNIFFKYVKFCRRLFYFADRYLIPRLVYFGI